MLDRLRRSRTSTTCHPYCVWKGSLTTPRASCAAVCSRAGGSCPRLNHGSSPPLFALLGSSLISEANVAKSSPLCMRDLAALSLPSRLPSFPARKMWRMRVSCCADPSPTCLSVKRMMCKPLGERSGPRTSLTSIVSKAVSMKDGNS